MTVSPSKDQSQALKQFFRVRFIALIIIRVNLWLNYFE